MAGGLCRSLAAVAARAVLDDLFLAHRRLTDPGQCLVDVKGLAAVLPHKQRDADAAVLPHRGKHRVVVAQRQKFLQVGRVGRDVDELRLKPAAGLDGLVIAAVNADVCSVYFHG